MHYDFINPCTKKSIGNFFGYNAYEALYEGMQIYAPLFQQETNSTRQVVIIMIDENHQDYIFMIEPKCIQDFKYGQYPASN